jgi:hypothetical protein
MIHLTPVEEGRVALKIQEPGRPRQAMNEIALHRALNGRHGRLHPGIIRLIEAFVFRGCITMTFERHGCGLYKILRAGPMDWNWRKPPMPNPLSPPPPDRDFTSTARRIASDDLSLPVQEIVGRTPHWLLRSGSMAIAGGLSALLLLGFIIHYPDVIASRITLTGVNPPVAVVARNSGNLQSLRVKENDPVRLGALLGVIANSAESSRIFRLREDLEKLRPLLSDSTAGTPLSLGAETQLGSVQPAYAEFHYNYNEYQTRLTNDFTENTLSILRRQLEQKRTQITDIRQ